MKLDACTSMLVVLWGLIVTLPAQAQTAAPLTLDDCIRLAQSAPSSLTTARQQIAMSNLAFKEAQAAFRPTAQASGTFIYNSPFVANPLLQSFVALNGVHEHSFFLQANEEVDLSGRLRADRERARADLDASRVGETLSQRDLKRAVSGAYYRLLLVRHIAQSLADSVAEAGAFEQRTRVQLENGEASQADVAKAAAATAALRLAQSQAEVDVRVANQELASFWTADVDTPLAIVDVFESAPGPNDLPGSPGAQPFMNRPEFRLFGAQRTSFLAESRRVRATFLPQANVAFEYGFDSPVVGWSNRGYALFVNLNVPIFDWRRTLNSSREFRIRAEQIDTQRAIAERDFSREYQAAQARLDNALQQIALAARQVQLGQDDLRLSRVRFDGGEGLALDVVAAQNELVQARVSYFTAISTYWNARADWEVAVGQ